MFTLRSAIGALALPHVAEAWNFLTHHSGAQQATAAGHNRACADLKMENNGTYYSVLVEVGTPGQPFAVVADTGSNSLIVPSCICKEDGHCNKQDRCFRGTNKSSTFFLPGATENKLQTTVVTFGSGQVQAVRANDMVKVGTKTANMSDGLLLMVNQALTVPGPFEGILGLGLPGAGTKPQKITQSAEGAQMPEVMRAVPNHHISRHEASVVVKGEPEEGLGGSSDDPAPGMDDSMLPPGMDDSMIPDWIKDMMNGDGAEQAVGQPQPKKRRTQVFKPEQTPRSFLEQAEIERFSMCFNNQAGGVLAMNVPELENPLQNVGQEHWGLDFEGISLGEEPKLGEVLFCNDKHLKKNQRAACGIIPDSGTTAIMGPERQVGALMDGICSKWPRCHRNHTALRRAAEAAEQAAIKEYGVNPWDMEIPSKGQVFQMLLLDCTSWLDESKGLEEEGLPDLHFHVRGGDGKRQTLKIPGADYIMSMNQEDIEHVYKHVPGMGDVPVKEIHTGNFTKVCSPSFGAMEYPTVQNGDVWILGVPLFSQYNVAYDLKSSPPLMSFTSLEEYECGTCKKETALVSESTLRGQSKSDMQQPKTLRKISGPWRVPNIDKSRPF